MTRSMAAILRRLSKLEKRVKISEAPPMPGRRGLERRERSPLFRPPPPPFDAIVNLALQEISDEQLELLIGVAGNQEKGLCWTLSQSESAALDAYSAARDLKRRAGLMPSGDR